MSKEKSNIDIINENVRKTIEKTIDNKTEDIADIIIEKLNKSNKLKKEIPFYRKVEILLYNYENIKAAITEKEEIIKELEEYGLPEKSKSIVVYSTVGGDSQADRYAELKGKYEFEKLETERTLKRIDNALDKIRDDRYFNIIKYKYLNPDKERIGTDEELAVLFNKERITIIRNRKRLINKLVTILFPESLKEVL